MKADFKKNYYPNLFTWEEFEYLINIRPLLTDDRVWVLEGDSYKWGNSGWAINKNCYPPFLFKEIIEKHLCYLSDMSRCTEKVNAFAKRLEDEYEHQTDAHIYICLNTELEHPFGAHYDRSHNVIVQCEGTTNFKVWDEIGNCTSSTKIDLKELPKEPVLDVDMEPGDAIWIPRYFPHLATSKTKRLSISFPINHDPLKYGSEDREWVKIRP